MKRVFIFSALLFGLTDNAHALELDYVHKYEDVTHQHTDEFEIEHDFESGIGIGAKAKFHPQEQADGSSGKAFTHARLDEKEFKTDDTFHVTDRLKVVPGMEWAKEENKDKYKPSLKLKYSLFEHTRLSAQYRREIIHRGNKSTKLTNKYEGKIAQKFGNFTLAYALVYYHSNVDLYNNQPHDYEYKVKIGYQATRHLTPYVEAMNESVDDESSRRQTQFSVGVNYRF
ncbi:oligogalacturonate-specific porin KdgM family protein [Rouxiella badensis]|jgi:hypothetical protein|uniref:oligogalacturonate-specific porin KdgM family protein n=1 Tax=Rouxiella badensis TaxID=1646377 RepID=UPI0013EF3141|nr:oligogalacturonate-specific porin KdgM family protein [Rouxiella badensis]MCC3719285.1 oligogalacturonate-specific porin KdgM family protein [Rouxiella badensis]MCC3728535.1 oligogalacturonate-specific porin KdgM family protein [Rouxiella badensis]MCC3739469.1 oligogalacturonate-specific porin KdgM family protein [Rouxiella badensis]QII39189.1 hypothetical protein G3M83_16560 [Rouxiella badensis]